MLLLLLGLIVLLVVGSLNIFSANWQHSFTSSNNNPADGPNWSRVWLLPLKTGSDRGISLLTKELQRQLTGLGLQVELAPANYQLSAGEQTPVVLEYAVGEWSTHWAGFGRRAIARVVFQTRLFGDMDSTNTLRIQGSFSGMGRYRGLVQLGRVNEDMASKVASAFVKQLGNSLGQTGVAYEVPPGDKNGFSWSFSLKLPEWLRRPPGGPFLVSHAMVLNPVDYSWQFVRDGQEQQVYLYRIKQRGDELERELSGCMPAEYDGGTVFLDLDYNGYHRRSLCDGSVSHWSARDEAVFGTSDPLDGSMSNQQAPYAGLQDQELERYVLVIDPPPAYSGVHTP